MLPLTKRQREILDYLNEFIQNHGYAPSLEEIGRRFNLSSLATVHKHLSNLQEKGFIRRAWNRSRSVELVPTRSGGRAMELPLLGFVAAGVPIEAVAGSETIAVPETLAGKKDAYVLRVTEIVAELHASRSPRAAVKRALDRVGRETAGILQNARETADEITLQSRSRADERRQEAEREAERLRTEAEAHVRALDAATDEIWVERRRIVDSTLKLGERLEALAKEAAVECPADGEGEGEGRRAASRQESNGSQEDEKERPAQKSAEKREGKPVSPARS